MELAVISMKNHVENQEISRQIRDYHKKKGQPLAIRFSEELTHIILEAPCLFIPDPSMLKQDVCISGTVRVYADHAEIYPRKTGSTIHLFLDSELIDELEQIRAHVKNKTQDEVISELLMRGLRSYHSERKDSR